MERLQPERDPSRNPLFQVALTLLNAPGPKLEIDGLVVETIGQHAAARFDLDVTIQESQGGELDGVLSYNTDLFLRATAEQIARGLCTLLGEIAADPDCAISGLCVIADGERDALSAASAGPTAGLSSGTAALPTLSPMLPRGKLDRNAQPPAGRPRHESRATFDCATNAARNVSVFALCSGVGAGADRDRRKFLCARRSLIVGDAADQPHSRRNGY